VLATVRAIESEKFNIGKVDLNKVNIHGGSIAIGHPFGATGGRMILQTLHELKETNKQYGLISVCAAGGLGSVMILERN
jgi:acetyl-CoA acyltransferase